MTFGARALGSAVIALSLLGAGDARAARPRVTVVDADASLAHALDVALSPWGVEVDERAVAGPGATMPMATDRARELARGAHADVVVWLSRSDAGFAVWVYDADADHASARRVDAGPPFDETTAAGIALSVKTILRATKVAPPRERFGAVQGPSDDGAWRLELGFGAAVHGGTPGAIEPRGGLGASVWPAVFAHRAGLAFGAEVGTGLRSDDPRFTGTALDVALRVAVAASLRLGRVLALEPSLGGAAHVVVIDGFVTSRAATTSIVRLDPAVEPRLALDVTLASRLHVAPWIGLACMTRSQEITVRGATVLDAAPLVPQAGIRVSLGVE